MKKLRLLRGLSNTKDTKNDDEDQLDEDRDEDRRRPMTMML